MPLQALQAPKGLLNEKERGSISSIARGCSLGAGEVFGEGPDPFGVACFQVDEFGQYAALRQSEGGFDRVGRGAG